MIQKIQKRWEELDKKKYKSISKEFGISLLTAKKYIHMSFEEIQSMNEPKKYKKRKTMTDEYINIIYKMTLDRIEPEIIFSYVVKCGYTGTWIALGNRIERLLKNNFGIVLSRGWYLKKEYPEDVTIITRNELVKHITSKNKKNEIIEKYMDILIERYPIIQEAREIYDNFYDVLMGKDKEKLDIFIQKYEGSILSKFVEGIKKDIAPIKNAISFPYSSGFVEGNNNKFKLIKCILYGRSKLVNLFRKCYVPFLMNNTEFKLIDILKKKNSTISCTA